MGSGKPRAGLCCLDLPGIPLEYWTGCPDKCRPSLVAGFRARLLKFFAQTCAPTCYEGATHSVSYTDCHFNRVGLKAQGLVGPGC